MTKKNLFLFFIIILLSLLGGVAGGVMVRSYLLNSSFNVPLLGDINLGSSYQGGNLIISQPGKVVVEQESRLTGVISAAQKSVVHFYAKKSAAANQRALDIKNFY